MRLPLCWFAFVLRLLVGRFGLYDPLSWLVGCFGFNGPLIQYFSLYRAVSQRKGEREEKGQMRVKMSKQPPPAPTASAVGPCLLLSKTVFQSISSRLADSWLVGCFGFNGPLRQYFSLYRAVSQREGERGKKG